MADMDSRPDAAAEENGSGLAAATKNVQAFVSEIAEMSKQSIEHATQTLEKLRNAHGVDEVAAIQTSFVKEAVERAGAHARRFSELLAALPVEMTKSYQEAWFKSVNTAIQAAEAAGKTATANVDRFSDSLRK